MHPGHSSGGAARYREGQDFLADTFEQLGEMRADTSKKLGDLNAKMDEQFGDLKAKMRAMYELLTSRLPATPAPPPATPTATPLPKQQFLEEQELWLAEDHIAFGAASRIQNNEDEARENELLCVQAVRALPRGARAAVRAGQGQHAAVPRGAGIVACQDPHHVRRCLPHPG